MSILYINPCTRCGKERVFIRTWKETIDRSVITTTENACPDTECQKIVDQGNRKYKANLKLARLKRKASLSRNGKLARKIVSATPF